MITRTSKATAYPHDPDALPPHALPYPEATLDPMAEALAGRGDWEDLAQLGEQVSLRRQAAWVSRYGAAHLPGLAIRVREAKRSGVLPLDQQDAPDVLNPPTRQSVDRKHRETMQGVAGFMALITVMWGFPIMMWLAMAGADHDQESIKQLMPAFVGAVRHPANEAEDLLRVPAQAKALDRLEWFHVKPWGGVTQLEVGVGSLQCESMVHWLVAHPVLAAQLRITVDGSLVDPSAVGNIPCYGPAGHIATTAVTFQQAAPGDARVAP